MRNIPSIIVTNDWFTGLVSAYAKNKNFSNTFDSTKFFHIIHNLDKEYEGRLYLSPQDDVILSIYIIIIFLLIQSILLYFYCNGTTILYIIIIH
jgi:glycogen synthase